MVLTRGTFGVGKVVEYLRLGDQPYERLLLDNLATWMILFASGHSTSMGCDESFASRARAE